MGHLFSKSEFYFVPGLVVTVGLVTAFFSSTGDYNLCPSFSEAVAKSKQMKVDNNKLGSSRKFLSGEGSRVYLPIFKKTIQFDRRPRPTVMPKHETLTKDDYKVCLSAEVLCHTSLEKLPFSTKKINQNKPKKKNNYKIEKKKINEIRRKKEEENSNSNKNSQQENGIESKQQLKDDVLPSIYTETVKDAVAEFTAEDCVQKTDELSYRLKETMQDKAVNFDLIVDDVKITDLYFPPQNSEKEKNSTPEVPIINCEKTKLTKKSKKKDDSPLEITQISDLQEKYFDIADDKNVCSGQQNEEEVVDTKQIEVKEVLVMSTCKKKKQCSGKTEEDITAEVVDVDGSEWVELHL